MIDSFRFVFCYISVLVTHNGLQLKCVVSEVRVLLIRLGVAYAVVIRIVEIFHTDEQETHCHYGTRSLVFSSSCFVIVHWHHLLYICLGGSVRNPNNLLSFWCVKHLILHGCGVVIFKDSKYAISTMVAFSLMAHHMEQYINETLQLEGGFDALMDVFQLKSVLIASRKVAHSLGRLSVTMDSTDAKTLAEMKYRAGHLKAGNVAFIRLLQSGNGRVARCQMNSYLKDCNNEIPLYLTTFRLRILAAQKAGILVKLNRCETEKEQWLFNKRLVAELWTVAKIDATGWQSMSFVQILSLDDRWLQKNGLWNGKKPLPKASTLWSDQEKEKAQRMKKAGYLDREIAAEIGRSSQAVKQLFFRLTSKTDGQRQEE